ncbi:hypothetical protein BVRB_6g145780 [Beta vulgaris subsp. vulgaris]|nr:hypothetical protein BVRB_6g145780 [Beta vulgaris subsp. vulgaris]
MLQICRSRRGCWQLFIFSHVVVAVAQTTSLFSSCTFSSSSLQHLSSRSINVPPTTSLYSPVAVAPTANRKQRMDLGKFQRCCSMLFVLFLQF